MIARELGVDTITLSRATIQMYHSELRCEVINSLTVWCALPITQPNSMYRYVQYKDDVYNVLPFGDAKTMNYRI